MEAARSYANLKIKLLRDELEALMVVWEQQHKYMVEVEVRLHSVDVHVEAISSCDPIMGDTMI